MKISVRPEVLLAGVHRKEECGGAVKLYLSKSTPLTDAGAGVAAALLKRHCEEQRPDCRHHNRHLLVVDVFASRHFPAPQAVVARGHELNSTCQEIAAVWPVL